MAPDDLLRPTTGHAPSAGELRTAISVTRARLRDVLHARTATLVAATSWTGPHRDRYEEDAADLLHAGRELDASLSALLSALDAEQSASGW